MPVITVAGRRLEVHGPWRDSEGRVCGMTAVQQHGWATGLGARLLTAREFDAVWQAADVRVIPCPRAVMRAPLWALDADVRQALLGRDPAGLLIAAGKTWVEDGSGRTSNYGFLVPVTEVHDHRWQGIRVYPTSIPDAYAIQPVAHAHGETHRDYSQLGYCGIDLGPAGAVVATVPLGRRTLRLTSPLMRGDDVRAAQRAAGVTSDGLFGPATERAVKRLQRGAGLLDDGVVGPLTWAAIDRGEEATAETEPAPRGPLVCDFIRARHFTPSARTSADIRWIVLHSTENPIAPGVSRAVARWFEGQSAPRASAHYVVGPDETIQCVRVEDVAWAAPCANRHGIQVEQVGQALKTAWLAEGRPVLERSAAIVSALCARWEIPVVRVDAAGLPVGERGITTHASVTAAFKRSDHVDPGGPDDRRWPWAEYLEMVRAAR